MKKYLFTVLHIIALFLCYVAFGILIYWVFQRHIPLLVTVKNSYFVAIGTFFLLPIIGIVCIKFSEVIKVNRPLGYLYLVLWMVAVMRFINIILTR